MRCIIELRPDLVLANQEENRRVDVERMRAAGIPVWVTVTETVPAALNSLQRMFTHALRWGEPAWLTECRLLWDIPIPQQRTRVAIPIWRHRWMVIGGGTFTGALAALAMTDERYPICPASRRWQDVLGLNVGTVASGQGGGVARSSRFQAIALCGLISLYSGRCS